jgi:hypothetical protein
MRRIAPITTILLAISAGCGDQASPEYKGEPLMTFQGVLVSRYAEPLPASDIVIAWPDWSKGDGTSAPYASFARLPVDATLPARFSGTIFDPPPETAYAPVPKAPPRLIGPRYSSAVILLARQGKEVTSTSHLALDFALRDPNEAVLATFDNYILTYVESDGTFKFEQEDGTIIDGPQVTKGYHLGRVDSVVCATAYDDACIAMNISFGIPADSAWEGCVSTTQSSTTVEVPLDTEMTLTIEDPTVPPQKPPLCDMPPA